MSSFAFGFLFLYVMFFNVFGAPERDIINLVDYISRPCSTFSYSLRVSGSKLLLFSMDCTGHAS